MSIRRLLYSSCAIVAFLALCGVAAAQETSQPPANTAAEPSSYFEMRRSKDVRTRTTAERYLNLTKTQEWTSDKGTKILAKYVAHADDLSSVTLAVVRGSGAARTVKEVTVPTNRLNKACQSRVKQIATLQKLLDELAAKAGEEPADPNQPGGEVAADPGTPMVDEQGAEPRPRTVRRPSRARPSEIEPVATGAPEAIAPAAAAAPADDGGGNDPLGFGELPANPPVVAGAGGAQIPFQPPGAAPVFESPEGVAPPVARADPRAWRTDYEAFRANIQVDSTLGVPQVKFRSIRELQAAVDEVGKQEADGSVGEEEIAERAKKFAEVGEFIWETTLVDADVSSGDWTQRLNLAPLPEPLSITFQLQEKDPGNWQSLQTGDRVRFTGRFIDYATGDLIAEIRFPEDQPAPPVKRR